MKLKILETDELTRLYHTEMVRDFPPSELKPLNAMLILIEEGRYQPLGLFDRDELQSYALTWLEPGVPFALLDYLGTVEGQRGKGLGRKMLDLLAHRYEGCRGILAEVEEVFSDRPEERAIQQRRLDFYTGCGFRNGGYHCGLFGVRYLPMIRGGEDVTAEELLMAHREIYRRSLPAEMYQKFVQIPLGEGETLRVPTQWKEGYPL